MLTRSRPPRIAIPGAQVRFANTVAELINLSATGTLIRMSFELRRGGEWPLVLDTPKSGRVFLRGRVVRCRRHEGGFLLALSFVSANEQSAAALRTLCAAPETHVPSDGNAVHPLPWRLPTFAFERLLRIRWSSSRECPECHSGEVAKEQRHAYSCFQCGCRFTGFRIGKIRVSL